MAARRVHRMQSLTRQSEKFGRYCALVLTVPGPAYELPLRAKDETLQVSGRGHTRMDVHHTRDHDDATNSNSTGPLVINVTLDEAVRFNLGPLFKLRGGGGSTCLMKSKSIGRGGT